MATLKNGRRRVIKATVAIFQTHKRLIIITFELFWILVFVLDRLSGQNSVEVPQFIYVSF